MAARKSAMVLWRESAPRCRAAHRDSSRIPGLKIMSVQDAELVVILFSVLGGLFGARLWSVAAVAVIGGLFFSTLLALFVSPAWKRFGFERYFENQAGNFLAFG